MREIGPNLRHVIIETLRSEDIPRPIKIKVIKKYLLTDEDIHGEVGELNIHIVEDDQAQQAKRSQELKSLATEDIKKI